jgi:micrococcal nuclease
MLRKENEKMYEYSSTLVKIVDGDTVDVLIDLGFNTTKKERVRLLGIDTPESATKDLAEKKLGIEAKEYITQWFAKNTPFRLQTTKDDKYGRILGVFTGLDEKTLNSRLVDEGYAWAYNGGTKVKDFAVLLEKRNLK